MAPDALPRRRVRGPDADLHLVADLYLRPTPLGTYHAASSSAETPPVRFLRALLRAPTSPPLTTEVLTHLAGADPVSATALLTQLQEQVWVEGHERPVVAPAGPLEVALPRMLRPLSSRGRALLADQQGFCLASVGFGPSVAPGLAALSADLASTTARHAGELRRVVEVEGGAWALVDGFGNSQLGFWPLFIGSQRFVLAIAGLPRLNQPELTDLMWSLSIRYGRDESPNRTNDNEGNDDA